MKGEGLRKKTGERVEGKDGGKGLRERMGERD